MEYDIALTSIFLVVLVVTATAKSALDELSDVSLRLLVSEAEDLPHADFWRSILDRHHQLSFTLTFGIHLSIASIAILLSSISLRIYPEHFLLTAFSGMILTVIIFRQIVPLVATQNDPMNTLLRLRAPLRILWPLLALGAHPIYRALRGLHREGAAEKREDHESREDNGESELQAFLDVGEEEGIIEESEGEMIQSIIRFSDRTVAEVMTPRTNIVAVEAGSTIEQVRDIMIESKYSRLPVYCDQIDHIEGVIYVRDLISCWKEGNPTLQAIDIARGTYFVPETKPIDELLHDMQKAKAPMAIVIDEYGGLAGLVTLEDLIEEIVGEIEDEDEPEPQETEVDMVDEGVDASVVRGAVEVGKIERRFDVELSADDFTTVAGLVINQLGHLPAVGEEIDFKGLHFEVIEADERRVSRVRIKRLGPPPAEADSALNAAASTARLENGK
ncbi:MAG: HlyC/CorC family transporter [Acidobacteriota bacterium]|nr:MAG: HlyC/CorC family transporter [Acidobacteriota bacterium]